MNVPNEDGRLLIALSGRPDAVVLEHHAPGPAPDIESVGGLARAAVIFYPVSDKGVSVTAVLLVLVSESHAASAVLIDLIVFEEIICVLVPNRNPVALVPVTPVSSKSAVLNSPAQEDSVLVVVMADVVFHQRIV